MLEEFEADQDETLNEFEALNTPNQSRKHGSDFQNGVKEIKERIKTNKGKGCDVSCQRLKAAGMYIEPTPQPKPSCKDKKCSKSRGSEIQDGIKEISERAKKEKGCDSTCKALKENDVFIEPTVLPTDE